MNKSLVERSRENWTDGGAAPSIEFLYLGCLQRIAATLESLNRSWSGVQEQNVRFRENIKTLEHQNRALRGQITKLKKARS